MYSLELEECDVFIRILKQTISARILCTGLLIRGLLICGKTKHMSSLDGIIIRVALVYVDLYRCFLHKWKIFFSIV